MRHILAQLKAIISGLFRSSRARNAGAFIKVNTQWRKYVAGKK